MTLDGKQIIVTGGTKGMGAALARDLVAQGAVVVALDIDEPSADGTGDADTGGALRFLRCDVADEASVQSAMREGHGWMGGLWGLVHAAGIATSAPAEAIDLDTWERIFAVNARGTFLTNRAAFPMLRQAGGRILNFASAAGMTGLRGKAHYAATKGAVLGWTRSIALEWGRFGITANALAPMIWTPMYEGVRASMTPAQLTEHDSLLAATMPIGGRLGVAERDLAPLVRFLMGEGSRYITGQTFSVDGGMVMVR